MENKIKISVVVPIYNAEKTIRKCVESILLQSLKEIEIICVNDGSTDNTFKILKELSRQDSRMVILNEKNSGASSSKNKAIKKAQGEYCLTIDSDDWIERDYLENMYKKIVLQDLDILISDAIFDYSNFEKNFILKDLNIDDNKIITGKEYIDIFLKDNFYGYTWNKLIKTSLYIDNNIYFNENIFYREDSELILKLAYYSKRIGKINKGFYHYVQTGENSVIKVNERKFFDMLGSFEGLEVFFQSKDKEIYERIRRRKIFDLLHFFYKENLKNLENINKICNELIKNIKKENFYIKKYNGEQLKFILLFNFLKVFPSKKLLKLLRWVIR